MNKTGRIHRTIALYILTAIIICCSSGICNAGIEKSESTDKAVVSGPGLPERVNRAAAVIKSGDVFISVKELGSGETAGYHADAPCQWSSALKIAVLDTLMNKAGKEKKLLDTRYVIKKKDFRLFSPIFGHFQPGLNPTYMDLAYWMMKESDNTASDILINRLTLNVINEHLKNEGLASIQIKHDWQDYISCFTGLSAGAMQGKSPVELRRLIYVNLDRYESRADMERKTGVLKYNACSADDMVRLVEKVVDPGSHKDTSSYRALMRFMMAGGMSLAPRMPSGTEIYGKTGSLLSTLTIAALVKTPDRKYYIIAIAINAADRPATALSTEMLKMIKIVTDTEKQPMEKTGK